jgi:hypothetical protein
LAPLPASWMSEPYDARLVNEKLAYGGWMKLVCDGQFFGCEYQLVYRF